MRLGEADKVLVEVSSEALSSPASLRPEMRRVVRGRREELWAGVELVRTLLALCIAGRGAAGVGGMHVGFWIRSGGFQAGG